jgi:hypothetical protein
MPSGVTDREANKTGCWTSPVADPTLGQTPHVIPILVPSLPDATGR